MYLGVLTRLYDIYIHNCDISSFQLHCEEKNGRQITKKLSYCAVHRSGYAFLFILLLCFENLQTICFVHNTYCEIRKEKREGSCVHLKMEGRCFWTLCIAQEIIYAGFSLQWIKGEFSSPSTSLKETKHVHAFGSSSVFPNLIVVR